MISVVKQARFLRTAIVLALLALGCSRQEKTPEAKARNLLVICIDTLRADRLGSYGHDRDTTPVIDGIAARGMLFESAFAHSNWTVPATASLITGTLPSAHGAGVPGEIKHYDERFLLDIRESVPTLAELLREKGRRTAMFSANVNLQGGFQRGFDETVVDLVNAISLTEKARDWLASYPEQPFFLYLQYIDVHEPIWPPANFRNLFPTELGEIPQSEHSHWLATPDNDFDSEEIERFRRIRLSLYDAALRFVDRQIEKLLRDLRLAGTLEDTLVVVTSDHGEEFWDHAKLGLELGGDPRGRYGVGHGHTMFDELLRVPWVMMGPGIPAGVRVGCTVGHQDLLPTILPLLGVEVPTSLPGQNLLATPMLLDADRCDTPPVIAESPAHGPDSKALIWQGKKLIVRNDGIKLLFDLSRDPGERENLAPSRREMVAEMVSILEAELAQIEVSDEPRPMLFDEEGLDQLRVLGYVE